MEDAFLCLGCLLSLHMSELSPPMYLVERRIGETDLSSDCEFKRLFVLYILAL